MVLTPFRTHDTLSDSSILEEWVDSFQRVSCHRYFSPILANLSLVKDCPSTSEFVSLLFKLGSQVTGDWTAFHLACQEGNAAMVENLIQHGGFNVNQCTIPEQFSPVHIAAWEGKMEVMQMLLDNTQIDLLSGKRLDAIDFAARQRHSGIVEMLIQKRMDISKEPLPIPMTASQFTAELMQLMKTSTAVSLLWIAAQQGNMDVVSNLLSLGFTTDIWIAV